MSRSLVHLDPFDRCSSSPFVWLASFGITTPCASFPTSAVGLIGDSSLKSPRRSHHFGCMLSVKKQSLSSIASCAISAMAARFSVSGGQYPANISTPSIITITSWDLTFVIFFRSFCLSSFFTATNTPPFSVLVPSTVAVGGPPWW